MALITELPANLAAAALVATTGSLLRRHRQGAYLVVIGERLVRGVGGAVRRPRRIDARLRRVFTAVRSVR